MIVNNHEIRALVLSAPRTVSNLCLTEGQVKLYKKVKCRGFDGMTTNELSKLECISPQNASAKLRRLHKLGYLNKSEAVQPSGGIEFTFTAMAF